MTHVLIAAWIGAIGALALAPASRWLSRWGIAALAPALGTAVYVVAGSMLAALGLFSVLTTLLTSTVVGLISSLMAAREGPTTAVRELLLGSAMFTGLIAVVSTVALNLHTARFSNDSFRYLISASSLDQTGGLDSLDNYVLVFQHLAVPLIHATGWLAGDGYSPVLSPVFGAATLAAIGWLTTRVMTRDGVPTRRQVGVLAAAATLLLTTNRFVFNLTYINGHMLMAMLLLVGVGVAWLGIVEGEHRFLYIAGISLSGAAITRSEGLIVIAVFLVPLLAHEALSLRDRLAVALPITAVSVIWHGVVLTPHLPGTGLGTAPLYGNTGVALLLTVLAVTGHVRKLRPIVGRLPWLMVASLIILLVVFAGSKPQLMASSLSALAANGTYAGSWGFFWYAAVPLLSAVIVSGLVTRDHLLNFGLAGFFLVLPSFAFLRDLHYSADALDSANRILLHVVPLIVTYLVVAAGKAALAPRSAL